MKIVSVKKNKTNKIVELENAFSSKWIMYNPHAPNTGAYGYFGYQLSIPQTEWFPIIGKNLNTHECIQEIFLMV